MTTTRKATTTVTHPDGTVSKRNSVSKVYTHAIEVADDNHMEAAELARLAERREAEAEQYSRALAEGHVVIRAERWAFGGRRLKFALIDTATDAELYAGAHIVTDEGVLATNSKEADVPSSAAHTIESLTADAARLRKQAAKLAAGPQTSYGVVRWSQTERSAVAALASFNRAGRVARVVPVDAA
ncbi:hypothetical protein [Kribbella sp. CA-293567]|uniref:hypothetical protein n=1 Tax=Kribbella sp. CA-293567 TaxID=3002436 RepID=UPI0022DDCDBD|nr:hypothetical protein [Kribbella sp. CA-293567]WBQ03829.1 hypothetical protein OX958_28145 [Kribbella sp. CA-293567]